MPMTTKKHKRRKKKSGTRDVKKSGTGERLTAANFLLIPVHFPLW
jgi:hypothetical protein